MQYNQYQASTPPAAGSYLISVKVYTKTAQVVTGLQIGCYKPVHKLSASCVRAACSVVPMLSQQVWNKLLTTCNKFDVIIGLVARLFQQDSCSLQQV